MQFSFDPCSVSICTSLLSLIVPVLLRVREQQLSLILIAAYWPRRPWIVKLVLLLCSKPWLLPLHIDLKCFLQDLLDKAFSSIKVYLAAISACLVCFDNAPVGQHSQIRRFMKGACRLQPAYKPFYSFLGLAICFGGTLRVAFSALGVF